MRKVSVLLLILIVTQLFQVFILLNTFKTIHVKPPIKTYECLTVQQPFAALNFWKGSSASTKLQFS